MRAVIPGLVGLALLVAPGQGRASGRRVLLPEGDAARGALVFARSACERCHVLHGRSRDRKARRGARMNIPLGGPGASTLSDGQLAGEIVVPSHRVRPDRIAWDEEEPEASPMFSFARALTLQDLADLVDFLRPHFPKPKRRKRKKKTKKTKR